MRAEKGECELSLADVAAHPEGIAFIAWPHDDLDVFEAELPRLREALPSLRHVAASWLYRGDDNARIERFDRLARKHGCTILATNDVHYHAPDRRPLQDVVTCIREKTTIAKAGFLLNPNAERHLKSPAEMIRLFERWPHAISATREFADCAPLQPRRAALRISAGNGARGPDAAGVSGAADLGRRGGAWPDGVPEKVGSSSVMSCADRAARFRALFPDRPRHRRFRAPLDPPILCQGRGSAANSAVCYCLGITAVDPSTSDLLFERFISEERARAARHRRRFRA